MSSMPTNLNALWDTMLRDKVAPPIKKKKWEGAPIRPTRQQQQQQPRSTVKSLSVSPIAVNKNPQQLSSSPPAIASPSPAGSFAQPSPSPSSSSAAASDFVSSTLRVVMQEMEGRAELTESEQSRRSNLLSKLEQRRKRELLELRKKTKTQNDDDDDDNDDENEAQHLQFLSLNQRKSFSSKNKSALDTALDAVSFASTRITLTDPPKADEASWLSDSLKAEIVQRVETVKRAALLREMHFDRSGILGAFACVLSSIAPKCASLDDAVERAQKRDDAQEPQRRKHDGDDPSSQEDSSSNLFATSSAISRASSSVLTLRNALIAETVSTKEAHERSQIEASCLERWSKAAVSFCAELFYKRHAGGGMGPETLFEVARRLLQLQSAKTAKLLNSTKTRDDEFKRLKARVMELDAETAKVESLVAKGAAAVDWAAHDFALEEIRSRESLRRTNALQLIAHVQRAVEEEVDGGEKEQQQSKHSRFCGDDGGGSDDDDGIFDDDVNPMSKRIAKLAAAYSHSRDVMKQLRADATRSEKRAVDAQAAEQQAKHLELEHRREVHSLNEQLRLALATVAAEQKQKQHYLETLFELREKQFPALQRMRHEMQAAIDAQIRAHSSLVKSFQAELGEARRAVEREREQSRAAAGDVEQKIEAKLRGDLLASEANFDAELHSLKLSHAADLMQQKRATESELAARDAEAATLRNNLLEAQAQLRSERDRVQRELDEAALEHKREIGRIINERELSERDSNSKLALNKKETHRLEQEIAALKQELADTTARMQRELEHERVLSSQAAKSAADAHQMDTESAKATFASQKSLLERELQDQESKLSMLLAEARLRRTELEEELEAAEAKHEQQLRRAAEAAEREKDAMEEALDVERRWNAAESGKLRKQVDALRAESTAAAELFASQLRDARSAFDVERSGLVAQLEQKERDAEHRLRLAREQLDAAQAKSSKETDALRHKLAEEQRAVLEQRSEQDELLAEKDRAAAVKLAQVREEAGRAAAQQREAAAKLERELAAAKSALSYEQEQSGRKLAALEEERQREQKRIDEDKAALEKQRAAWKETGAVAAAAASADKDKEIAALTLQLAAAQSKLAEAAAAEQKQQQQQQQLVEKVAMLEAEKAAAANEAAALRREKDDAVQKSQEAQTVATGEAEKLRAALDKAEARREEELKQLRESLSAEEQQLAGKLAAAEEALVASREESKSLTSQLRDTHYKQQQQQQQPSVDSAPLQEQLAESEKKLSAALEEVDQLKKKKKKIDDEEGEISPPCISPMSASANPQPPKVDSEMQTDGDESEKQQQAAEIEQLRSQLATAKVDFAAQLEEQEQLSSLRNSEDAIASSPSPDSGVDSKKKWELELQSRLDQQKEEAETRFKAQLAEEIEQLEKEHRAEVAALKLELESAAELHAAELQQLRDEHELLDDGDRKQQEERPSSASSSKHPIHRLKNEKEAEEDEKKKKDE